jgi:hypothetical protein
MLSKIQQQFKETLFDVNQEKDGITFISSNHSVKRFNIYRQTVIENLRNALEITYPGIWQLLGKECADEVARYFSTNQIQLPLSGCLDDWGEKFPSVFAKIEALGSLPYLEDYANYEWCKQLALSACKLQPLSKNELANYPNKLLIGLQFEFQPSVQLYHSIYPLEAIEDLMEKVDAPCVELNQGPSFAYIVRINTLVETFWLNQSEWLFIKDLKEGCSLNEALSSACEIKHFNLTKIMCFIFETQSISKIKNKVG